MTIKQLFNTSSVPTTISDPFKKECIDGISMRMMKDWQGRYNFKATVYFENGDTRGEQNIIGENFADLYKKTYEFCESMA